MINGEDEIETASKPLLSICFAVKRSRELGTGGSYRSSDFFFNEINYMFAWRWKMMVRERCEYRHNGSP